MTALRDDTRRSTTGAYDLVIADVDGTLVTSDKELTSASISAADRLRDAGVSLMLTSGRPPRGLRMFVEPLALTEPIAAFNGGMFVSPDMSVLERHQVDPALVEPVIATMRSAGLDVWVYRDSDWFVTDPDAPHVDREARTVEFQPTVVDELPTGSGVVKIVGVSDDPERIDRGTADVSAVYGGRVAAVRSQPYYLDVTNPEANKGGVVEYAVRRLGFVRERIAVLGDQPNDLRMFRRAGLGIAVKNADPSVRRAAGRVTESNDDDGFAAAVDGYVLGTMSDDMEEAS
jgi:Cof subfamily protein (haloacid dehalogenase superfamily)